MNIYYEKVVINRVNQHLALGCYFHSVSTVFRKKKLIKQFYFRRHLQHIEIIISEMT